MQEKATFMGVADMPLIRTIDSNTDISSRSLNRRHSIASGEILSGDNHRNSLTSSSLGLNESGSHGGSVRALHLDNKHDTRIVNEAFQVIK